MIGGIVPNSFVDYPGKIAMLIFTAGCNLNCWYCHNRQLIRPKDTAVYYSPASVFAELERKKGFLDAVVITGGEPTLQKGLAGFAADIKKLGYLVKLDTNGTNPGVVQGMISAGVLDRVDMDIKAPLDRYGEVCGRRVDTDAVRETIALLMESGKGEGTTGKKIDYSFRTTFVPELTGADLLAIAQEIKGAKSYVLQQYRPVPGYAARMPHPPEYVRQCASELEGLFPEFRVLGL